MRSICALLTLAFVMGCSGSDGKDGSNGVQGPAGPPGSNGQDGDNGEDGAPGKDGENGADGEDGTDGEDGAPGEDGQDGADGGAILQGSGPPAAALGADGDVYIDTVSHDVYQKTNDVWNVITNLSGGPAGPKGDPGAQGEDGEDGQDGASVLSGSGAPAAGLGKVGDVYIDSASGNLYSKGAGGWALTGSLKGADGEDGEDGADGEDGEDGADGADTLRGVRWFAFGLSASFMNMPSLVTSETYTDVSSAAVFTFTTAGQSGRIGFKTTGSYLPGGVDLRAFDALNVSVTVSGAAGPTLAVYMDEGANKGCRWDLDLADGPDYVVDLDVGAADSCYNTSGGAAFSLASVTDIQIGIVSSGAGARTLTITDIQFIDP